MASTSFLLLLLGVFFVIQGLSALDLRPPAHNCPPVCEIYCKYGNVLDSYGCPTCRCKDRPTCPVYKCPAINCPYGRQEENGCPTCRCKPGPVCPKLRCLRPCPNGYETKNGCQTCTCLPAVEPPPGKICPPVWEIGCLYGKVVDSNGCPTCKCRERPVCLPLPCPGPCPNGVVIENGCPTCTCLPDVCRDKCSRYCANPSYPSYPSPPGCTCECRPVAY